MAAPTNGWPRRVAAGSPYDRASLGTPIVLNRENLGFDPAGQFHRLYIQLTGLGGGTVDIDALGPGDTWTSLSTGQVEGDVYITTEPFPAYRLTFSGATGLAHVEATAQGF